MYIYIYIYIYIYRDARPPAGRSGRGQAPRRRAASASITNPKP